ncbi:MAG: tripartite tricarboxylate transporter substrate binding protein [Betaproteobacteria bacterium]|nr:tripartite tricarboxylate transporter substrate binding protein [Betaproteobacteria bacterium]
MRRMLAAMLLLVAAQTALAQGYPSKPVRVIVPYPTGGIVDIVARAITEKIAAGWGHPILVEGRPGADSNIGTDLVAKSAPDGYTWLVTGPAVLSNPTIYGNLSWDPLRDFQAVGIVVWNQNIAVVPATLPVNSMKEFVEYAKARPGQLNFGNPGTGSSNHLSTELFIQVAGIRMVNIGYKGQPPAIPDLLNGALHFKIVALGLAAPHVRSGKLKALATFTHERVTALPEVPTIAEAGFPEAALVPWYGAYVRAGTPREIVERINSEINKALRSPEVSDRLLNSGSLPGSVKSADEIQAMMRSDYERWGKVVRAAGIKAQ